MDNRKLQYRRHTNTLWHGVIVGVFQEVRHIYNPSLKRYKAKNEPIGAVFIQIETQEGIATLTIDEARTIVTELTEALRVVQEVV